MHCAVKDVFSNRIVGYSISDRMKARLAVDALTDAFHRRGKPAGVTVHSDRGSQFRSRRFRRALRHFGLRGSMGRVGACADNAAMENWFSLLQKNVPPTSSSGPPVTSFASRSCTGSRHATTDAAVNEDSGS